MVVLSGRRIEQRERLLEAAYDLVADVGIEGLRTREICRKADLNLAIFHYCFVSKDDLLRALYQYIIIRFRMQTEHLLVIDKSSSERLESMIRLHAHLTQHMAREVKVWRVFSGLSDTNTAVRDILKEHFSTFRESVAVVLQQGMDSGEFPALPVKDASIVAAMIVSLQNGMIMQLGIDPEAFDADRYASAVFSWVTGKSNSIAAGK